MRVSLPDMYTPGDARAAQPARGAFQVLLVRSEKDDEKVPSINVWQRSTQGKVGVSPSLRREGVAVNEVEESRAKCGHRTEPRMSTE